MLDTAQSEPALQRSFGNGRICFGKKGLVRLFQQGCAKIILPKTYGNIPQAVLVNTAGGLTGGDHLGFECSLENDTSLCLTSQTAERIYRSCDGVASVENRLILGENAYCEWLPQETILFDHSSLRRSLDVTMESNSRLLALESNVFGRKAMGETLTDAHLIDRWRIRRGGQLIYADALQLRGELEDIFASKCTFRGQRALASLLYVAPDAQNRLDQARRILDGISIEAAASAWNGILLVRFLAPEGQELRDCLGKYLVAFRGENIPRVWQV